MEGWRKCGTTYWKEAILWTGTQGFALIIVFFKKRIIGDCFKNYRKRIWEIVGRKKGIMRLGLSQYWLYLSVWYLSRQYEDGLCSVMSDT